LPQNGAIFII